MLVVVGGHSRNIGKTSVVCGIIRGLPEFDWTAIKITQYGHGVCSRDGAECGCADRDHKIALSEEREPDPKTDSGRYLEAGARRSFWLRTPAGELAEAMPQLRRLLATGPNVIVESNSILGLVRPDVCLMVLDGNVRDFKISSLRYLDRVGGLVFSSAAQPPWPEVVALLRRRRPSFFAPAPAYTSPELLEFVKSAAPFADSSPDESTDTRKTADRAAPAG